MVYVCEEKYLFFQPHTDCFVVSQLFTVAWPAKCFKLGFKPSWLYISWTFYLKVIVILSVREGIFSYIFLYILHLVYSILEQSYCMSAYVAADIFPTRVLKPHIVLFVDILYINICMPVCIWCVCVCVYVWSYTFQIIFTVRLHVALSAYLRTCWLHPLQWDTIPL